MAKKTSRDVKGNAAKKVSGIKAKKAGMFKALTKQEKRASVVGRKKSDIHKTKRKAKRVTPVANEFRNFDERMAAKTLRRPRSAHEAFGVASLTFVMAPPTFQFNANAMQPAPAPREVEGFHGFVSALNAPKDVPIVNQDHAARQSKPMQCDYHGSNVFAALDDGDEEQQKKTETNLQTAPAFMQPATFTLASVQSTKVTLPSSLRQNNIQPAVVEIDPDL
ncbi:unnamed protein product [Peronospora destructor]|uniref:Uncharacterized protein n=1 Tax=Peronospora destructor TaxID=86335 RepID=A0AAV0UB14_9STRA|nr:unnamed protein product [Peronospora destructor]